jgi:predicted naringenin-chalcone synthase
VGSNNTVAATYQYDPYGVVQAASQENGLGQTNIIRYAGGTYDPATRLTMYGRRGRRPHHRRLGVLRAGCPAGAAAGLAGVI